MMDLKKISYLVGGRGFKRKGVGLWWWNISGD